jgi:hypothetical protein
MVARKPAKVIATKSAGGAGRRTAVLQKAQDSPGDARQTRPRAEMPRSLQRLPHYQQFCGIMQNRPGAAGRRPSLDALTN